MKKTTIIFLVLLISVFTGKTFAHEGHYGNEKKDSITQIVSEKVVTDTSMQSEMKERHDMKTMNTFPNYHPLVVHFPIVLLLMATLFQFLSFFLYKKEFSLATLILLGLGVVSSWLASNTFHAHPEELTGKAKEIFETHEQMASLTGWFSLIALVIKIISHFFLERKWWTESAVIILLAGSAITVSIAGHHGAMLVHMEGIGPQGKHMESNHNH